MTRAVRAALVGNHDECRALLSTAGWCLRQARFRLEEQVFPRTRRRYTPDDVVPSLPTAILSAAQAWHAWERGWSSEAVWAIRDTEAQLRELWKEVHDG